MTQGPTGTHICHRCTLGEMPHMIEHRRAAAVAARAKLRCITQNTIAHDVTFEMSTSNAGGCRTRAAEGLIPGHDWSINFSYGTPGSYLFIFRWCARLFVKNLTLQSCMI
uniref:Uncharacterized protein n=1 Tax=Ostreococcus mediterraneus TaxID=1486918 RepID=A0A7S0KD75_9CHLO|mmetsp:Transcript_2412/g.8881  ORF Transcript_2412/g.8881 Transcript_2412/m.8881 type:complete len:110 (+) Transcript_2412:823-1152(+)